MMMKTTSMKFTSRASVKIKDSFYTFEAQIEKQVPLELAETMSEQDLIDEKQKLWDECNAEVDSQVEVIVNALKK